MSLNNLARVTRIPFSASAYTGLSHFLAIDRYLARSTRRALYRNAISFSFFPFSSVGRCSELALKRGARLSLALIAPTFRGDIPLPRFARLSLFCLISLICGWERARERRFGRDNVAATSVSRAGALAVIQMRVQCDTNGRDGPRAVTQQCKRPKQRRLRAEDRWIASHGHYVATDKNRIKAHVICLPLSIRGSLVMRFPPMIVLTFVRCLPASWSFDRVRFPQILSFQRNW